MSASARRAGIALLLGTLALLASVAHALDLTAAERAWIAEHPTVRYSFNPRSPPISFVDAGTHQGFAADVMKRVSQRTGIDFRPDMHSQWPSVLEQAATGELPVVALLAVTIEREKYLSFSEPLLVMSYGIFTQASGPFVESLEDLRGKRVGVPRDFVIAEWLQHNHPELMLAPFDVPDEGMARLSTGEYDAVVTNLGAATYLASAKGFSNLRLRAVLPQQLRFAIGVSKRTPELAAIVTKAVASIPDADMRELKSRWFQVPGPGFTRAETIAIAVSGVAVVFLFAAFNIAFLYMRLRGRYEQLMAAERKLQEYATADDLTGLGNRRAYVAAIEAELQRASRNRTALAFMELDLDHFKAVNDLHGHEAGDRALQAVGGLIRSELRLNDVAFRTGGEEFVVLLPGTDAAGATVAAERFRRRVASLQGLSRRITASIGCAVLPPGHSASSDALFAAADRALYQAKAEGRDCVRIVVLGTGEPQAQGDAAAALRTAGA